MFGGGLCLIAIFYFLPSTSESSSFRSFSELHIQVSLLFIKHSIVQVIYGTFFLLSMMGVIIFVLLPKKQQADSIASNSPRVIPGFWKQFGTIHFISRKFSSRKLIPHCYAREYDSSGSNVFLYGSSGFLYVGHLSHSSLLHYIAQG